MSDRVSVPKGWKLAAPEWGSPRSRRNDAKGGQVCGVLIWNYETGEGEVLLQPGFYSGCAIVGADAISDWAGLLDREYEAGFPLSERRRQREEGGDA
jgi:hypothetical protein